MRSRAYREITLVKYEPNIDDDNIWKNQMSIPLVITARIMEIYLYYFKCIFSD